MPIWIRPAPDAGDSDASVASWVHFATAAPALRHLRSECGLSHLHQSQVARAAKSNSCRDGWQFTYLGMTSLSRLPTVLAPISTPNPVAGPALSLSPSHGFCPWPKLSYLSLGLSVPAALPLCPAPMPLCVRARACVELRAFAFLLRSFAPLLCVRACAWVGLRAFAFCFAFLLRFCVCVSVGSPTPTPDPVLFRPCIGQHSKPINFKQLQAVPTFQQRQAGPTDRRLFWECTWELCMLWWQDLWSSNTVQQVLQCCG